MKVHLALCFRGVEGKISNEITRFSSEMYRAFIAEIQLCIGGFSLVLYTQGYLPCKSAFINATLSAK